MVSCSDLFGFEQWGAGTNLKVGDTDPTRSAEQLVVLVSAFVMVSTVWSVSCLLFFYSRCPCARHLYKLGARAPVPYRVGATGFESDGRVGFGLRSARSHWIQLLYSYFRAKPETQLRYAKHRLHYRRSGRRCWLVPTSQTEVWLLSPRTSQVRRALASSCSDRSVQEINMLSKTVVTFFLHTTFIHQKLAVSENELIIIHEM